jgi:glycolate oxidase FAD binding subunit
LSEDVAVRVLRDTREAVHDLGGSLLVERCPLPVKGRLDVWDEVGESLGVMRRMKRQYDSRGVLNPGRFVGGI